MSNKIDLGYRPDTYFRPQKLERYLLSRVKGAVLRQKLQALFYAGRHAEVRTLLTAEGISAADAKPWSHSTECSWVATTARHGRRRGGRQL